MQAKVAGAEESHGGDFLLERDVGAAARPPLGGTEEGSSSSPASIPALELPFLDANFLVFLTLDSFTVCSMSAMKSSGSMAGGCAEEQPPAHYRRPNHRS